MPAPASATADEIRSVNASYHDGAAAGYDAKWGIDYGEVGRQQVLGKVRKALGGLQSFGRSLEVGAGTGYFSLNMLQAGVVADAVCTDISHGMLEALQANARRLDLDVTTIACDAEQLPFDDGDLQPPGGQRGGAVLSGRTAADHDDVVVVARVRPPGRALSGDWVACRHVVVPSRWRSQQVRHGGGWDPERCSRRRVFAPGTFPGVRPGISAGAVRGAQQAMA